MMMLHSLTTLFCCILLISCQGCSNLACTSTLRKTILKESATAQVPLLAAEVDVLMQRRNTRIGSMYSTYDELYNDRLAKNAIAGRADVEAAIKSIQRFTLQRKSHSNYFFFDHMKIRLFSDDKFQN